MEQEGIRGMSTTKTTQIHRLNPPGARSRPMPRKIMHPSAYGLANAVTSLIRDYGKHGAVNMLIDFAEMVRNDQDCMKHVMRGVRVEIS